MSKNVNDFSVAKVGDTCWSSVTGEGIISEISRDVYHDFPITVKSNTPLISSQTFSLKGSYFKGGPQCLFWAKPEFIAPERPMRLVAKVVKVRPYRNKCIKGGFDLFVEPSMKEDPSFYGPEQDITIEVWEE